MEKFREDVKALLVFVEGLPVLGPVLRLLKSRAVVLGLATFAVNYLLANNPDFEPYREPLNTIVLVIIGKMGLEDGAEKLGAWLLLKEEAKKTVPAAG